MSFGVISDMREKSGGCENYDFHEWNYSKAFLLAKLGCKDEAFSVLERYFGSMGAIPENVAKKMSETAEEC